MNLAEAEPMGAGALLEREQDFSILDGLLEGVRSGSEGRLVLIGGEAGVGKTALLRRFCATHSRSARILWGACEPLRTPEPLGPFLDIAEAVGGDLQALIESGARAHEIVVAVLKELRDRRPTVLVLEDVHWADEATLDVVTLLAARISAARAIVLGSYRDDELDRVDRLRFMLGELLRGPGRRKVEPLSREAVAALAGPHGVDGEELYRTTGGNPFFVTEVLAAGGERIPETVRDAILARASRISDPARRLLEAVAVVPGRVDLWLLEALAPDHIDGLEECLAAGVLTSAHTDVAFRHELARLAIEEAIPPNRRLALHRAALAALEERGGESPDYARLAHHADAARDAGAVRRWAPIAAERAAASGAHDESAAQYERALRYADGFAPSQRGELLERRTHECWVSDQFDAAIESQEQALHCWRELGDRRAEGDALRKLSRLKFFVGRVGEGEALARQALEVLEQLPPGHELAMAYGNVSQRRMVMEDREDAIAWGTRALGLARDLDDPEVLAYALTNVGAAEFQAGSDEGLSMLEQALAIAQRHRLEDHVGRAFSTVVLGALRNRRLELAAEYLERGFEYCDERGLNTWRLYLLTGRARLELCRGDWDEAAESASSVLRDPRSATYARGLALTTLGLLRARRGDPGHTELLDEEGALARSTDEPARIGPVAAAKAEAAWLGGRDGDVGAQTDVALSLVLKCGIGWVVGELAYWRWQVGIRDALPDGSVAEPYRLSLAGDATRAAALWTRLGCPYEAAIALADSGNEPELRRAHDALKALGADPAAAITARRLRERGARGVPRGPRRRTQENPAGLTARELDVLALLAEGLQNAQIAERLIVSRKTIDHHVSAILRKLDVRTRGEAAAKATRLGLTQVRE